MPAPWHPIPSPLPPVHLYRHILRESSYLPPAFRDKITATIRDRFHRHRKHDPRAKAHLSRAGSALRTLRAANSGDAAAMAKLIARGFSRSGSGRRELMAQFVKAQGPNNSEALEALLDEAAAAAQSDSAAPDPSSTDGFTGTSDAADTTEKPAKKAKRHKNLFYQQWDQPKLMKLLRSQRQQQGEIKGTASWPTAAIKTTNTDQFVPAQSIWGKPPAEVVVQARRARWWRLSADKLIPPLSRGEWELLGRLSQGAQDDGEWAVPQRRPTARALATDGQDAPGRWDWRAYATMPADVIERQRSMFNQRRTGQKGTGPYSVRQRRAVLPPRWFRRQYNLTWLSTPTMSQDANTLRYSVSWGKVLPRLLPATSTQLDIFQGVDERGQETRPKDKQRQAKTSAD